MVPTGCQKCCDVVVNCCDISTTVVLGHPYFESQVKSTVVVSQVKSSQLQIYLSQVRHIFKSCQFGFQLESSQVNIRAPDSSQVMQKCNSNLVESEFMA